jgi:hypothetical protein
MVRNQRLRGFSGRHGFPVRVHAKIAPRVPASSPRVRREASTAARRRHRLLCRASPAPPRRPECSDRCGLHRGRPALARACSRSPDARIDLPSVLAFLLARRSPMPARWLPERRRADVPPTFAPRRALTSPFRLHGCGGVSSSSGLPCGRPSMYTLSSTTSRARFRAAAAIRFSMYRGNSSAHTRA